MAPLDYSSDLVPNFRALAPAGLPAAGRALGFVLGPRPGPRRTLLGRVPAIVRAQPVFRRNPLPGSLS